ncbi:S-layer homology domain-containing protein [Paenibacillus glycanilyticus]|uniref:S-layer homology domain-containing protein n=1 Tax=Paenibacillus glycanilyticus TaxID=126569 RepID=UPI00203B8737|nr:S-layer homology domain-containing protein [Paenibacillus glycanilyticus]MCM3630780.1 S-layer homology domain-containing protein [Paenibacillus glycanilyticus]
MPSLLKKLFILCMVLLIAIPPLSAQADGVSGVNNEDAFIRIHNPWQGYSLYEDAQGKVRYGYPAANDPYAQWMIEEKDGHKRIKNRATGHYMNSEQVTDANITNAVESTAIGEDWVSDTWDIAEAAGKPGEFNLISTRNSSWIVNFQIQDGNVQSNNWAQKDWGSATWTLDPAEESEPVRIVNPWNGSYLYEEEGEVKYGERVLNDTSSQWFVEDKDGHKRLRNRSTGHYLHSQAITAEQITNPVGISDIGEGWTSDLWSLEAADDNGGINIVSSRDNSWIVNIQGAGNGADGIVRANNWAQKSWGSAVWKLEPASDSVPKRIKNNWKGTYLYEDNGQIKYGEPAYSDKASQWILIDSAEGTLLRNLATGHYVTSVDYAGATPLSAEGTPSVDSNWIIAAAKTDSGGEVEGYVTLRSAANGGSFINVQNQDGFAQGNNWAQATWGSAQWALEDPAPPTAPVVPYIRIKNNWLQLYLFEDPNGVVQYGNVLPSDQNAQWLVEEHDGVKRIKNRGTGHYLNNDGVTGDRDALKSTALAVDSTAGDWTIETYQGYKLISKPGDDSGKYVNAENKLKHAQYSVVPKDWGSPKWEFVTVGETAPAYVRLKNSYFGQYLYENEDGKVAYGQPDVKDPASQWSIETAPQGVYIVNRATGHMISNENINRDPGNETDPHLKPLESLTLDKTWGSVQWTMTDVEGSANTKVFSNSWNPNWNNEAANIHMQDETGFAQASNIPANWGSAQWVLEAAPQAPTELPEGFIRIKNEASGEYLYENGSNVVLYGTPAANNAASHWKVTSENGTQRIVNRATGNAISIEHLQSYLETTASPSSEDRKVQWVVENGPSAGLYLLRSNAEGFEDNYIHTEDLQGYAQYELRSMESRGVQWRFETAPAEAVTVPSVDGPANAVTPVLKELNAVRIVDAATGKALIERNGAIVADTPAAVDGKAAEWLPQDYNGHKQYVNQATGRKLAVKASGLATVLTDGASLSTQWDVSAYAGYQLLSNASSDGQFLTIGDSGSVAVQVIQPSDAKAHWLLQPVKSDVRYEAEEAFMTGGVTANGAYVSGFKQEAAALLFAVNTDGEGSYSANVHYRNSGSNTTTLAVYINGLKQAEAVEFPATGNDWRNIALTLPLRLGMNTFSLQYDNGSTGGIEVDYLMVEDAVNKDYRGATVPFTTYEAEHGVTNGTLIEEDRTFKTFASEASGREAVRLDAEGQYVEFQTTEQANALTMRYIIPDASAGDGEEHTLTLYINGEKQGKITLSSKYSWVYGKYPWTNNPADGDAHRFYDESRLRIGDVPAGSTVRLVKEADDTAEYYVVDLVDLEQAPDAYAKPDGYVSVVDFGATASDGTDDSAAFEAAIAAAKEDGVGVWIPEGRFTLAQGPLHIDNVTIRGAGIWHTELHGAGFLIEGSKVRVYDLYMDLGVTARHDELREAGFDGTFGKGSIIQNVWIEHAKAGIWSMRSNAGIPTDGLYVGGVRIRDTYADGVNFTTGTRNSMIEQTHIRNSGDDSIALWSQKPEGVSDDDSRVSGNTVRFNTVQLPWLADNVAVFGGRDNKVQDNILSDTVGFGAGIAVSTRFNPVAFDGTTWIERNTLIRTGGREPSWGQNFGAIWLFTGDKPIDADIKIRNNTARDSTYQGLYVNGPNAIANDTRSITVENYVIDGTGTWGIHVNNDVSGSINLDNVIVRNTKIGPIFNAGSTGFELRTVTHEDQSGTGNPGGGIEPSVNHDAELKAGLTAGKNEIVIDLQAGGGSVTAEFSASALKAAASAPHEASIIIRSGGMTYTLPSNIWTILEGAGYGEALAVADAKLTITLSPVSGTIAAEMNDKAASSGFTIAGKPVSFELTLQSGGESMPVHQFGKHFVGRSFTLDGQLDEQRSSVVVYDPATAQFRTVPALFASEGGHTVVTVLSTTNSLYAVAVTDAAFKDLSSHWAKEDIMLLANKRIVNGVSADLFTPTRNITRAEFAALVVKALGLTPAGEASIVSFADVASTSWYASYVKTAVRYGIVKGMSDGNFRPNQEITRQEMAVMLARALNMVMKSQAGAADFAQDGTQIADWAQSAVNELVAAGIMQGKSAGSFAPLDHATRAEAAVTLKRLLQAASLMNK